MTFYAISIGMLALVGGILYRVRLVRAIAEEQSLLDDGMLRQIEQSGWIEVDEPLDFDAIREEEERFLESEAWEEPDEW